MSNYDVNAVPNNLLQSYQHKGNTKATQRQHIVE